ncbi:MAG TPA: GyrI-like domain-containing protein [Nitrososphaerales archaeon]|nr:GyrI-like domain-containing protein [Nitrososphaerales archaeon]
MTPDFVTRDQFESAREGLRRKKNPAAIDRVRLEAFDEGKCVQTMHAGPYSAEAPSIEMLERFAKENGFMMRGKHHEVYMGDPRRAAPSKLRTVIRHPVS